MKTWEIFQEHYTLLIGHVLATYQHSQMVHWVRLNSGSNRTHPVWSSVLWEVPAHSGKWISKTFLKKETSPASTVAIHCVFQHFTTHTVRTWLLISNLVILIFTACWTDFFRSCSQWTWRTINHCALDYKFSLTRFLKFFLKYILLKVQQKEQFQKHIMPGRSPTYPLAPGPENNQPVSAFSTILTLGQLLPWQTLLTSPHFHWGSTGRNQSRFYSGLMPW